MMRPCHIGRGGLIWEPPMKLLVIERPPQPDDAGRQELAVRSRRRHLL
jgi:hypothetical protein